MTFWFIVEVVAMLVTRIVEVLESVEGGTVVLFDVLDSCPIELVVRTGLMLNNGELLRSISTSASTMTVTAATATYK